MGSHRLLWLLWWLLLRCLSMQIRNAVRVRRSPRRCVTVSTVVVRISELAAHSLRHVGNDLHTTWNHARGLPVAVCVGRCRRSAEALCELLHESLANVVGCNMDSICDSEYYERSFGGERQAGIGGVQSSAGCVLNLSNSSTTFANDRSNEKMGDQQTERIRF